MAKKDREAAEALAKNKGSIIHHALHSGNLDLAYWLSRREDLEGEEADGS